MKKPKKELVLAATVNEFFKPVSDNEISKPITEDSLAKRWKSGTPKAVIREDLETFGIDGTVESINGEATGAETILAVGGIRCCSLLHAAIGGFDVYALFDAADAYAGVVYSVKRFTFAPAKKS